MERIVVLVTSEEKAKIKRAAGLISLSAWMRHCALKCVEAEYDLGKRGRNGVVFVGVPVQRKKAKQ
jgi:hypothetical protein